MWDKYLLSYYKEIITEILSDPDETKHFSVNINFVELSGNDPNLGNAFLRDPEKSLEEWDKALKKVQTDLILQSEMNYVFKKHSHCRIHSLPLYPELHRTKFPQNDDTNKFLQVSGTVVRMTAVKMLEYQRQYICTKCKYVMMVNAEFEMKNIITPPKKCGNPEDCNGTNIINMGELNAEFCKDYQEIKMQEIVSKLDVGSMPNSMWVTLEDDLVDSCKPGDNVTVCGLVKRRQNQFVVGKKMEIELVIKANHIQVNNNNSSVLSITPELKDMFQGFWKTYADTPLVARDIILKSICPQLFGLYIVKLAMAVVLAGGSNIHNTSNTGVRIRAEPHLLIVGDPGTGKSQLLRFASKIIPRSVLTTGVGSTAAGLTVTAVMENGEWQLEGGALVMSDGGICCIDEFNTMREHDRTSIHEAMEQQTISVAKASIVCKLSTRCSILAATNPKGNLDPSKPLNMNVALASPLLSRFDLILLLRDKIDDVWDSQLVDYIFNSLDNCNSSKLTESINWNIETLQAYFAVIKKIHPVLTEDSNKILSSYYQAQRRKNCRNKSRTTVRLLDSLVRLSQGHARLMYHQEVEIVDATVAVVLVETAMENDSSVLNLHFNLRNDFPQDPTSNYRELVEIVLKKLELEDLLKKELETRKNSKVNRPGPSGTKNMSPIKKTESKFFKVVNEATESNDGTSSNSINLEDKKRNKKRFSKLTSSEDRVEVGEPSSREDTAGCKNDKPKADEVNNIENSPKINKNKGTTNVKEQFASEEEHRESAKITIKRSKSENYIGPKKIKVKGKENDIQGDSDLAALKCIPSVNDIFRMDDCDLGENDEFGFNFRENIVENVDKPDLKAENAENKKSIESTDRSFEIAQGNKDPAVSSQRKRNKNLFNKFRFIPKDDNQTNASAVPEKNPFESDDIDNLDISFANVKCSTQRSTEEHKTQSVEKEESAPKESVAKKFNFKKVACDFKSKNLPAENPQSMFESQEIDDLELEI